MSAACNDCRHRLRYGTCAGPVAAGLAQTFVIVWPPEGHAEGCAAFVAADKSANLQSFAAGARPYRLVADEADRCHLGGWDDGEIAAFAARHTRLLRLGLSNADADDLAERLTLRDRDSDDRQSCAECRHGGLSTCPSVAPLPYHVLHRCGGFSERTTR